MARDPNVARLPQNPKISVGLTWEKEKEGEQSTESITRREVSTTTRQVA